MLELPEDLPVEAEEPASTAAQLSQCLLPLVQQLPDIYRDTLLATDFEGRNLQALAEAAPAVGASCYGSVCWTVAWWNCRIPAA
ncbi:hypothetical protein SAMN05660964_03744 [Thiothrix caldifontis]|uniref:Uncharacterized protein n=1 Tax=Thiothrix caldifontis TaxID=525918 RepID=A0A1H4GW06_9GAMM|nr:hypothetical protein [Thiothrix caldifontis]SEB13461.1 hypothetical protein SAMN05660964_03744 [Thiothrix caldifontis]